MRFIVDSLPFELTPFIDKGLTMVGSLVIALLIYIIGKIIARKMSGVTKRILEKSKIDATLVSFAGNVVFGLLMAVVIMAALNKVGVNTTSLVAVFGGAAVAIGLALQDQLSNFAAGVLIILFRPFSKGDYVGINGLEGTVEEIHLISTSLRTLNNHEVVIPNGKITSDAMTNYTSLPSRRVDVTVGIGYGADIKTAKDIMLQVASKHQLIFADPAPAVMVSSLGDSSVDLLICVWTANTDWLQVQCDLHEQIKYAFDEAGIEIPFPQRVVHMNPA